MKFDSTRVDGYRQRPDSRAACGSARGLLGTERQQTRSKRIAGAWRQQYAEHMDDMFQDMDDTKGCMILCTLREGTTWRKRGTGTSKHVGVQREPFRQKCHPTVTLGGLFFGVSSSLLPPALPKKTSPSLTIIYVGGKKAGLHRGMRLRKVCRRALWSVYALT